MEQRLTHPLQGLRQWILNRSMRTKLIIGISIVCTAVLLSSLTLSSYFEATRFKEKIVESYQTTAKLIAINLEVSVLFEDAVDAETVLRSLDAHSSIDFACVQLVDGTHLAHYSRFAIRPHDDVLPNSAGVQVDGYDIGITQPILSNGNYLGLVYIEGSMEAYREYLGFKTLLTLGIVALAIFLIIYLATLLGNRATNPILRLSETAEKITRDRDFSLRQKVTTDDEVGKLIRSFNRMMEDIEKQNIVIQKSEKRFRSYFELGVVGMALLDENLCFCETNDQLCQIIGYRDSERIRKNLTELISEQSKDVVECLRRLATGEDEQCLTDCWIETCNGQSIFVMLSARLIHRNAKEGESSIILLLQDITDRKNYEDALLEAKESAESSNRAKDEFLSIVSHELRTPLNPIIGYSELLEMELESEDSREHVGYIRESANHLLQIINTILDYTRFDRGIGEVSFSSVNFKTLCEECVALVRNSGKNKQIKFTTEHQQVGSPEQRQRPTVDLIETDKTKLRQILLNLISNALKFTEQGEILVKTKLAILSEKDASLEIEVQDTGIGIETEKLEQIFEPFQQGDVSLTRRFEGLGLGLAICKKIVGVLGGDISCTSELGRGSCFRFQLPVSIAVTGLEDDELASGIIIGDADNVVEKKERILVIDDDYLNRKIASSMLSRLGYEVDVAEDGEIGVEMAGLREYKAILMDIQMPRLNGFDATKRIKSETRKKASTPVIAVTAHAMNFSETKCTESGLDGYIGKPFSFRELQDKIDELCHNTS